MKNKKVLIISTVISIVLVAAILMGILYFTTDLFKTKQQLFYKYIAKAKIIDSNFITKYNVANDRITNNSNSSSAKLDISTNVLNQETGVSNSQQILSVISNGLQDTLLKQSYRDLVFSSNQQNFLTLKYIRDNNTYGIIADNILAKYLTVENSNLKDLFAKLGVEDTSTIPNSIPTDYEEILKIDETTLNNLKETYGTLIYNNINEESFFKTVNPDKTETIGVSLTEQEVFNILRLILETAKNDNTLLNLIISKAQLMGYTEIIVENMQIEIQAYIDELISGTYSNDNEFIKLSLIKTGKVVTKIIIDTYTIQKSNNLTTTYQEEQISPIAETVKQSVELNFSEANKIIVSIKEDDNEITRTAIDYSYDINNISLNVESDSKYNEEINYIKAQYKISNYQTDDISQSFIVDMNSNNQENYQINLSNNITLKQDVQISKLTTENSAKLNDMTSEELSQLFTALTNRIMTLYGLQISNLTVE